jgi:hypothetical protein
MTAARRLAAILVADVGVTSVGMARPKTAPTAASSKAITSVIMQGG